MKKNLQICAIVFMLFIVLMANSKNIKAAGTDFEGYIPISSADDLQKLKYSDEGSKFYLTKDIDLSSYGYWTSIESFKGILDGNGHRIDNLTSRTGGLFETLYPGATVRNIILSNVNISVTKTGAYDEIAVEAYGGIAGGIVDSEEIAMANQGNKTTTFENCYVSGVLELVDSGSAYKRMVGGIIGDGFVSEYEPVSGWKVSVGNIVIEKCISEIDIIMDIKNRNNSHKICVGGIAGQLGSVRSEYSNHGNDITNNYYNGQITVTIVNGFPIYVGGIVGEYGNGKMTNCYSIVTPDIVNVPGYGYKTNSNIASLVGFAYDDAIITSCYYYGGTKGVGNYDYKLPSGNLLSNNNKSKADEYKGWDFDSTWTVAEGINDGYPVLQLMGAYYQVKSPYANMETGTYKKTINVELFDAVKGAEIYYTTDGSTPTRSSLKYSDSITINRDTTLKMVAFYKNFAQSEVVSYQYKFVCVAPTANYESGKSFTKTTKIKLSTKEKNATIHYTTDGTKPTTKSKKYTGSISVSKDAVIKAITVATGKGNSEVSTLYYYVSAGTPTSNYSSGTYASSFKIKLKTTTKGATIYYTTNGKTPTTASKKYTGAFTVSKNTKVKAIAINGAVKSSVNTWDYKVKVTTPVSNKASGSYNGKLTLKLSTGTSSATIYYTTDGSKPTIYSLRYTGAITIYNSTVIKAIAIKDGMVTSDVFSCRYRIN